MPASAEQSGRQGPVREAGYQRGVAIAGCVGAQVDGSQVRAGEDGEDPTEHGRGVGPAGDDVPLGDPGRDPAGCDATGDRSKKERGDDGGHREAGAEQALLPQLGAGLAKGECRTPRDDAERGQRQRNVHG